MNRLKQLKIYPFGLFLWLEWIFLGGALLSDLPDEYLFSGYSNPNEPSSLAFALSLSSMLLIGILGLKLPPKNTWLSWLYFGVELFLFWLPAISGRDVGFSLFLVLLIGLRNGLIFQGKQVKLANILILVSILPLVFTLDTFQDFQTEIADYSATVLRYQAIELSEYRWIISIVFLRNLIDAALCIGLIWLIVNVVLREHRSQAQLAEAREQLRAYALKAEDRATVNERNRIAREIHDSLGHALTAQSIQLNNAIAFWQSEPDKAYRFILESKQLVATALREIRCSVSTLRTDPLQGQDLSTAINLLFKEFSQRTYITPHLIVHDSLPLLSKEVTTSIYRIVQEALTNIAKHSESTTVKVEIQACPQYLNVLIKDDGKGFSPQQNTTGMGLQGMRERAIALGGYLVISSQIGQGCTLVINIPHPYLALTSQGSLKS